MGQPPAQADSGLPAESELPGSNRQNAALPSEATLPGDKPAATNDLPGEDQIPGEDQAADAAGKANQDPTAPIAGPPSPEKPIDEPASVLLVPPVSMRRTRPGGKPTPHGKYWQELLGQVGGSVRHPMLELTEAEKDATRAAFETCGLVR